MNLAQIGSLVCHQVTERTLQVGDGYLPLCCRCTGIYAGFLIGIFYQLVFWRTKLKEIPVLKISLLCFVLLIALIVDSLGSYFKLWSLSNETRLILGLLGGSSISLFLFPVFNYSLFAKSKRDAGITKFVEYAGVLLLVGLFPLFSFIDNRIAYFVFAVTSIAGVIVLYLMVNTTIGARIISWKNQKDTKWQNVLLLTGTTLALTGLEFYFLYARHLKF